MGGTRDREWSVVRLAVTLVGLVLVLGIVVAGVVAAVWSSAARSVEPTRTADGSVCSTFTGTCTRLSLGAVHEETGIDLSGTGRLVTSGRTTGMKSAESWAVACVPDAGPLLAAAEADGFAPVAAGQHPGRHDLVGRGATRVTVQRDGGPDGVQWLDVAGPCDGGTTVAVGKFVDE